MAIAVPTLILPAAWKPRTVLNTNHPAPKVAAFIAVSRVNFPSQYSRPSSAIEAPVISVPPASTPAAVEIIGTQIAAPTPVAVA